MATHAGLQFAIDHPYEAKRWADASHSLVVLGVSDEDELIGWVDRLSGWCGNPDYYLDLPYSYFWEPDIKEHTAVAFLVDEEAAKKDFILPSLKLALQDRKDPRSIRESARRHAVRLEGGE
jgi:hypothetical protein